VSEQHHVPPQEADEHHIAVYQLVEVIMEKEDERSAKHKKIC
jgi:hypothetical protein